MSAWGKAVAQAKKKEKDPAEALKLAKRLYGAIRRKAKPGSESKVKVMKAQIKKVKTTSMKKTAMKTEIPKAAGTSKVMKAAKKSMKTGMKTAMKGSTLGFWGQAVAKAKKKEKDPVEMIKLAKRLYGALKRE
eukprot:TRINITY_DN99712_c0_g1_i1.p1 TRINITY_DN99712_c0_g1~~TRINITY_DN99712_c0_g1_i1.p1  ORF type:complete len:133 (+),score=51.54 TRINITY_DN99712_c0_g1_i1:67-465(+)